jgi:hypothetical protein
MPSENLLTIHYEGAPILLIATEGSVLIPTQGRQREIAYAALCDAFSLLCGVKLPRPISAMEGEPDQHLQQTGKGRADPSTCDVSLPSGRPGTENVVTLRQPSDHVPRDCR